MQIDNFHFEIIIQSILFLNLIICQKKILAYRGSFFCKYTKTHTNKGRTKVTNHYSPQLNSLIQKNPALSRLVNTLDLTEM